jgi:hypothetical protein
MRAGGREPPAPGRMNRSLRSIPLLVALGCKDAAGPEIGGQGPGLSIAIIGGDHQSGPAGTPLPVPLRVRVSRNGSPSLGIRLEFGAGGASGAFSPATATTADDGIAETTYRLGSAGPSAVTVRIAGDSVAAVFSLTATPAGFPTLLTTIPIPPAYGIHDTFVRAGIAFVCAWNTGVIIYDVGDGRAGGSPSHPVEISRIVTRDDGVPGGPAAHNSWWFWNPTTSERRYLFVGQEGPGELGSTSSGDIHVLDVADLAHPLEVASLSIAGAGTHNFWVDEPRQILYAAYYNAGVIAVDVSGSLTGDLASRILARRQIGGPADTYTWGVMLANGSLWASDMTSGLWRLDPATLAPLGGGDDVPDRWSSDLWIRGSYGYTGTWGGAPRNGTAYGNVVNVWRVDGSAPVLADSIVIPDVRTVSDLEVSDDATLLAVTTERLAGQGLTLYSLADPARPALVGRALVSSGLHTGSLLRVGGRLFLFAAKNPPDPALQVYDVTPPSP